MNSHDTPFNPYNVGIYNHTTITIPSFGRPSHLSFQALAYSLSLQFSLCLLVILCCIDSVLIVVDEVEPRQHMQPNSGVSGVSACHTLNVWCCAADAVQWLPLLDLANHLLHVQVYLALVLCEAVESHCSPTISLRSNWQQGVGVRTNGSLIEQEKTCSHSNDTCEAHNRSESTFSDV